jgi:hypothetical protein
MSAAPASGGAPEGPRSTLTAIDKKRTAPDSWALGLTFAFVGSPSAKTSPIPPDIAPANILITDMTGVPVAGLTVTDVIYPVDGDVLTVDIVYPAGGSPQPMLADPAPLVLQIAGIPAMDPAQSFIGFLLSTGGPGDISPERTPPPAGAPAAPSDTAIDYLARDYEALRTLMLNDLAEQLPEGVSDRAADPLVAIVEVAAALGDYLSYRQDAVATESYLATARRRLSVRRHARLLDYTLHEGCNARTFVALATTQTLSVPAGTLVVTRQALVATPTLPAATTRFDPGTIFFATMQPALLSSALSSPGFYTAPGETEVVLPAGATQAALLNALTDLTPGAVLIFAANPLAPAQNGDFPPHPVRVTAVEVVPATPGAPAITRITWHVEDALPAPLRIASLVPKIPCALIWGNAVLVDHGRLESDVALAPAAAPHGRAYRPLLAREDLTCAVPLGPETALAPSASAALRQDPAAAVPVLTLIDSRGSSWHARRDLLEANAFTRAFVVEPEDGALARLRFGDGTLGRRPLPGITFAARARRGNGSVGNLPAGSLCHVVTDLPLTGVTSPLAAVGGTSPLSTADARMFAPTAYRRQLRAVTAQDYAALAEQQLLVRRAAASVTVGPGGPLFRVSVMPRQPVDAAAVAAAATGYLAPFRVLGTGFEVVPPITIGLDIALAVIGRRGTDINGLRQRLARRFGTGALPDGTPAFFAPNNFSLGDPVLLSRIVAALTQIEGVAWVNTDRRTDPRLRFGTLVPDGPRAPSDYLASGIIPIPPNGVARADNDPARPANGRIVFYVMSDP